MIQKGRYNRIGQGSFPEHPQPYKIGPDDANQTITNLQWKRVRNTKRTVSRTGRYVMSLDYSDSMYRTGPQVIESQREINPNNGYEQIVTQPIKKRLPSQMAQKFLEQQTASLDLTHRSRQQLLPELFKTGQLGLEPGTEDQPQRGNHWLNFMDRQSKKMAQTSRASFPFDVKTLNQQSTQLDSVNDEVSIPGSGN